VQVVGPCELRPGSRGDHFTTLARAIVGQQVSAKAAEAIWQRFLALHDDGLRVRPGDVLAMREHDMRASGLSAAKVASIRDLAAHVDDGRLKLRSLGRRDDERIITELIQVRGIGRWTAEMFLLFKLGRPDVWPVTDLGIRNAVERHYRIADPSRLAEVAEPWRPWRSVASWYLWRSLQIEPV